jgi:NAD(P)-dependent dehydrogenase (short-subunit alcohol dehydrogenase family)
MASNDGISRRGLEGRVVLVTGAAQGIGRAVAEAVSAEGGVAVACDIRPEVRELGVAAWVADAASVADMERVVANAVEAYGRLDAVVANAGAAELSSAELTASDAAAMFDRMLHANLRTAYVTVRAALPHLATAGRGDIVLVSTDHVCPRPGARPKVGWMEGYDAAKWGLEGLQRNWAATLRSRGIRVNSLAMGETDTPMLRTFLADRGVPPEQIDDMASDWLAAADIAGVVVALLAEDAPDRTGTTIGLWPGFPVQLPPPPP